MDHIIVRPAEQEQTPVALSTLAEQINAEHRQAVAALNDGLEHAHRGGELLRQAKAQCPHGGFSEWLRKNFEGSERTAQMYMRIAKRWPQIEEAKAQRIALLTYSGAIKLLTAPKPARKAELKKLERLEGSELRNVVVATGSLVNVAEKPRPAPKPGQIKADGRLWNEVESSLGRALNRCDELHRQCPNANMHRRLLGQIKMAMDTLAEWKRAARLIAGGETL